MGKNIYIYIYIYINLMGHFAYICFSFLFVKKRKFWLYERKIIGNREQYKNKNKIIIRKQCP